MIYLVISISFVWMYVALFPTMQEQAEKLKQAFESYPQALMKAFNISFENFFDTLQGFMAGEYFSLLWPIIMIILVLSYSASAIAGEIEAGTIELLLAQPISRLKIFLAKYFSGIVIIVAFIAISNFSVVPLAVLHNVDYKPENFLTMSILGFLFAFAIFGIGMMLSAFFSSKGKVAAIVGGVLIIMYALNLFSSFKESLDKLKYASFFYYYDFNKAVVNNQIEPLNILVFLAVGIICAVVGAVLFVKRDIAT